MNNDLVVHDTSFTNTKDEGVSVLTPHHDARGLGPIHQQICPGKCYSSDLCNKHPFHDDRTYSYTECYRAPFGSPDDPIVDMCGGVVDIWLETSCREMILNSL